MEAEAGRSLRGLGWVAVAALAIAAVGVVYLHPSLAAQPAHPAAAHVATGGPVQVVGAAFTDRDHGLVSVIERSQSPGFSPVTYSTSDGGRTWTRTSSATSLEAVVSPQGWVLQARSRGPSTGLSVSLDAGRTWRSLPVIQPGSFSSGSPDFVDDQHGWWLARQGPGPNDIHETLWRTVDGGRDWEQLAAAGMPQRDAASQLLFLDPRRGVLGVLATDGTLSLLATQDGGETWRSTATLSSPRPGARLAAVALLRHGTRLLAWLLTLPADQFGPQGSFLPTGSDPYLDVHPYLAASDDGGLSWGPLAAGPDLELRHAGVPVVDGRGRLLLLEGRRLWVSQDDGATWTARVAQAPYGQEPAFLLEPAGSTLLATASSPTAAVDARFVDALLRSADGGVHWNEVPLPG